MRELKYLKLFEAFESVKLTKILGYINQESKNKFLDYLKKLSSNYDFPMSQFSDDMFQYLPFNKALRVNIKAEKQPCKATSKREFQQYGIEGEKCESGKIKRTWGSRIRIVDCPRCSGTGIEPINSDLKLLKFWFSSDRKLISMTGVDGVVRKMTTNSMSGFKTTQTIDPDRTGGIALRSLQNLQKVSFKAKPSSKATIGIVFKEGTNIYIIQDLYDGDQPNNGTWRNHGRYSWSVTGGDFFKIDVLEEDQDEVEDKNLENPYEWNVSVDRYFRVIDKYSTIENQIKDAHFALILDLNKIKSGDYIGKQVIQSQRAEAKSGSRLDLTDDEIRKQNIQRYIQEISKRADIVSDVSNIRNLVNRGIGGRWALFLLMGLSRYHHNFSRIIEYYYDLMTIDGEDPDSEETKKFLIEQINKRIQNLYSKASYSTSQLTNNLEEIKKRLKNEGQDVEQKYLPIVEGLERISQKFHLRVMSGKFETIEDLEIAKQRMINLDSFCSNNIYALDNLNGFCDNLINSSERRAYGYLVGTWRVDDYYDKIIRGLDIVEKLVERL